jgi:hypothetical protein
LNLAENRIGVLEKAMVEEEARSSSSQTGRLAPESRGPSVLPRLTVPATDVVCMCGRVHGLIDVSREPAGGPCPSGDACIAGGVAMDFIERIFGISPDGGSGAFEVLLFLIPVVGIFFLWERRRRNRR